MTTQYSSDSSQVSYSGNTSFATRSAQSKFQEFVSVKDFGAVGDGTTDDTTAIQNAVNWCQSNSWPMLWVPPSIYKITSTITVTKPVKFVGYGNGFEANGNFPATTISKFLWAGNSTTPVLSFSGINFGGFGIEGLEVDGNNVALKCVVIDGCVGGKFDDLTCRNWSGANSIGLHLTATTTNTCSWHLFHNLNMDCVNGGNAAIRLSGFLGLGNACHNTFINTRISHGANCNGIALGGCDNISFIMTYIYRQPGSTAYGVVADTAEQAGFPVANEFFHLEAGDGGYYQPSGSNPYNVCQIYGYSLDNGQPEPVVPNGGAFIITNAGQIFGVRSIGTKSPGNSFNFSASIGAGSSSYVIPLPGTEPDTNYTPLFTFYSDPGSRYWVSNITTTSFNLNFSSPVGGTLGFNATIIRN